MTSRQHRAANDEILQVIDDLLAAFDSIEDAESQTAAFKIIKPKTEELNKLAVNWSDLPDLPLSVRKDLKRDYAGKFQTADTKLDEAFRMKCHLERSECKNVMDRLSSVLIKIDFYDKRGS